MTYDIKITLKKVGIAFAEVVIAGLISYITTNNITTALAFVPVLEGIRNYIKNRNN